MEIAGRLLGDGDADEVRVQNWVGGANANRVIVVVVRLRVGLLRWAGEREKRLELNWQKM